MANLVYIATSLDGFISASDGGLSWLDENPNPAKSDYGYKQFMARVDALVMGRRTFDQVLKFGDWPYLKPVFVLSKSLTAVPESISDKVNIVSGDLKTIVQNLNQRGYMNLYIDGGRTIQSFLAEDMIDEIIITRLPILLGGGTPLFGTLEDKLRFKHEKTEVFNDILVQSHYIRMR